MSLPPNPLWLLMVGRKVRSESLASTRSLRGRELIRVGLPKNSIFLAILEISVSCKTICSIKGSNSPSPEVPLLSGLFKTSTAGIKPRVFSLELLAVITPPGSKSKLSSVLDSNSAIFESVIEIRTYLSFRPEISEGNPRLELRTLYL